MDKQALAIVTPARGAGRDNLNALSHELAGAAQDVSYAYTRNQAREIAGSTWTNDIFQWPVAPSVANGTKSYTVNGLNRYTAAAGGSIVHDGNGNVISAG